MSVAASQPTSTDLRVGVIGVGIMGSDHAERIADRTSGAVLAAVCDPDTARADELAKRLGCRAIADPLDLVRDGGVDAILVVSPGFAHEEQLLACLAAGKPVLCEKPLTHDAESSLRVVRAEQEHVAAGGRPLVQVGFMRRYDPEYAAVKVALESAEIGRLLLLHNVHRNKSVQNLMSPQDLTEDAIRGSLVHEVDVARFLFGEEITAIQVITPRPSDLVTPGVLDPQVSLFTMAGGGLATNEVFISSQLGYEVRAEAVGERGTLTLGAGTGLEHRTDGALGRAIPADYRTRFAAAYDLEIQAWADAARRGERIGPDAYDGYAASVVTSAGVESLHDGGRRVDIDLAPRETLNTPPDARSAP